jgi:hypothetical protein
VICTCPDKWEQHFGRGIEEIEQSRAFFGRFLTTFERKKVEEAFVLRSSMKRRLIDWAGGGFKSSNNGLILKGCAQVSLEFENSGYTHTGEIFIVEILW